MVSEEEVLRHNGNLYRPDISGTDSCYLLQFGDGTSVGGGIGGGGRVAAAAGVGVYRYTQIT